MSEFLRRLGYLPSLEVAPSIQEQQRRMDTIIVNVHTSSTNLNTKIDTLEEILNSKPKAES
jgi:hypothetical protein